MEITIKELGKIITGNTPNKGTKEFWDSKDIYFVKPDIISDNGITTISKSNQYISEAARKKARIVKKDAIFVTCIGSIGKIGIASKGEYAFNQQINAIAPNEKIIPKYLAYNLLFNKGRLTALANAPVVPIINKSQFSNFHIKNTSDINKQVKIVDVLDKLMLIIERRKEELSTLDDLIRARFVEMFGNPVLNDKKFSTLSGEAFFKLSNGKAVPEEKRYEVGIPAYGGNGISWYTNEVLRVKDTLVVGRVGFQSGNVHYAIGPLWITDNAMYISQYDKDKINLVFLCELMQRVNFSRFQDAGDLKKITQKPFMSFQYILPSMKLQQKFVDFKDQVDKSKLLENSYPNILPLSA